VSCSVVSIPNYYEHRYAHHSQQALSKVDESSFDIRLHKKTALLAFQCK
jgi:hypothetical protein